MLSKNDYVLNRAIFNEELHNAAITKDAELVESILTRLNEKNMREYDFSLFDVESVLDIDYVHDVHLIELKEENFSWAY